VGFTVVSGPCGDEDVFAFGWWVDFVYCIEKIRSSFFE
jgi:hypothetical protein